MLGEEEMHLLQTGLFKGTPANWPLNPFNSTKNLLADQLPDRTTPVGFREYLRSACEKLLESAAFHSVSTFTDTLMKIRILHINISTPCLFVWRE